MYCPTLVVLGTDGSLMVSIDLLLDDDTFDVSRSGGSG